MMTDPIADMLTRIRNAQNVGKPEVFVPYSHLKHEIAEILVKEGYIEGAEKDSSLSAHPELKLTLKYAGNEPVIRHIRRVSKPGLRVYVGAGKLPFVYDDRGIAIVSTSQGLMTNKEARSKKVGGEIICEIF